MSVQKDLIVFIEDSPDDSELTEFALLQTIDKVRLMHFREGTAALNFIFNGKEANGAKVSDEIKFVIVDIGLPTIDGLEVLRQLRANKGTQKLPVVILSSSRDPGQLEDAYHLGANSYVLKPNGFDGYVKQLCSLAHYWSSVNRTVM